jgi:hypothetical protein
MYLQTAERKRVKIKMGLQGSSGSGKSYSALLVAFGLCGDWTKVAVIDTENHSSEVYAHFGRYRVIHMDPPFSPERYIEAIGMCEQNGTEVIIIDSASHEWEFLLDYHAALPGNSFTAWSKVTPRHNQFIQAFLQSSCHIICTIRSKQDYVLVEKNGKSVPEKVGLKGVQRDGLEYDFTLLFELDIKNNAVASKDRTGLFFGRPEEKLTIRTGEMILEWCNRGTEVSVDDVSKRIGECRSLNELLLLYKQFPEFKGALQSEYEQRKRQLIINNTVSTELNTQNTNHNGTFNDNR